MDKLLQTCEAAEGSDLSHSEYKAQLFDHTEASITDEVYNIIYDYTHDAVRSIFEYLTEKYSGIDRDVIKNGSEALKSEIIAKADVLCGNLEAYLSNNGMKIPDDVLLPEDVCHLDKQLINVNEKHLDQELQLLRSKINEEIISYQLLREEGRKLQNLLVAHERAQQILGDGGGMDELSKIVKEASTRMKDVLEELKVLEFEQ